MQHDIYECASIDCNRPNGNFGVRVGTWNLDGLSGKGEVCEELRSDVCCWQEVRWRGQCGRMLGMKWGRYKLWWSGKGDGDGFVGGIVKEELCE